MKIAIIGYSGSGKSTLAAQLSNHYSIPNFTWIDCSSNLAGRIATVMDDEQMDNFCQKY